MHKIDDILDHLDLPENKKEEVRKVIDVLRIHHPKIRIDEEHRDILRKKLLREFTTRSSSSRPFWYSYISLFGVLCTSFFIVFGIYTIFSPFFYKDSLIIPIKQEHISFSPVLESNSGTSERIYSQEIVKEEVKQEMNVISKEIHSIEQEIMDSITGDSTQIGLTSPEEAITLDTPIPESDLAFARSMAPSGGANAKLTQPSMAPFLEEASVNTPAWKSLIPSYPTVMKLYTKDGKWTPEEILSRTGSGLSVEEIATEKISVLERKIERLIANKTLKKAQLIYTPLGKITKSESDRFTLVPAIELEFKSGEVIIVSLIRGYK